MAANKTQTRFDFDCTTPVQIQRKEEDGGARHIGRLMGNVGNRYLILQALGDLELVPGDKVILRMLLGNAVVGFETVIRDVMDRTVKLILADYPQFVETINLRKSDRIKVFIPTDVRASAGLSKEKDLLLVRAMILNISSGGCCFSSKTSIEVQQDVNLSFSLPGETHVYNLNAIVMQTKAVEEIFAQRVKFGDGGKKLVHMGELGKWIDENATFAIDSLAAPQPI